MIGRLILRKVLISRAIPGTEIPLWQQRKVKRMADGTWIQLGRDFINFFKPFLMKAERRKSF
jgi:hypothetical protein